MKMSLRGEAEAISKDEIPRYARNDREGRLIKDDKRIYKHFAC